MLRVRIFIDYWNFQISWNRRAPSADCDWVKLPTTMVARAREQLVAGGILDELQLEEILVHASVESGSLDPRIAQKNAKVKAWLTGFLDSQPGFRVKVADRQRRSSPVWCNSCQQEMTNCPHCNTPLSRAGEKAVDAALITDMFALAWENAYDIAILASSDGDYIPAVERLQDKGLKIINATWEGTGRRLSTTSWASFRMDSSIPLLSRDRKR